MELIEHLALGFSVALTLQNLAWALLGCVLGTAIGVLPGLGPTTTIAMLLPSIYALDATPALIMLAGIYYGAQYGGSTTAILVNLPGEASSVVTAIDGYAMARQGRAGPALAAAGLGSFFAGTVGTLVIASFAPPLTELAFKFGPAEYFSLMVLGLIGAVVLASGSLIKALCMILLGLLLGQINTDVISGVPRYSFDIPELTDGLNFVAIAMGIFGFTEIAANLGRPAEHREVFLKDVHGLWPTKQDFKDAFPAVLRGTSLGSILGVLPGSVGAVSLMASVAIGSLAAAALAVNNHRDIAHDRLVGRRTFAVSFGPQASIGLFSFLLIAPFALLPWMAVWADAPAMLLPLLLMPAALQLRRDFIDCPPGTAFNELLFRTFRLELWFAALLSAGALLGRMLG